jgi:hypothetical protein
MTDPRPSTEAELVDFVQSIDVKAPDSLHRKVELMLDGAHPGARRTGAGSFGIAPRLAAAGAVAAAAVAVAVTVGSSGGGSSSLSQRDAAALTLRPATRTAPRESSSNHTQLAAAVDGISFPYWGGRLGWRSVGARSDRVGGRTVTTVFYADRRGHRIGYAIVAGAPAPRANDGVVRWRRGTPFRLLSQNGATVVSWLRAGHLCVVSGRGVSGATLLRLVTSRGNGSVAS